ncbi:3504_t:CDS:2, partial [Paraglomus occultum]
KHFIAIPRDLKSRTHMTELSTPIVSHPKEASLETVSANNISRETKISSTPQSSLCPACKLSHKDEKSIRGRYEAGFYFIKCGQQEIEITAKILTDDYCKWHANLVDLPSFQTEKIRSRLYRAYTEETGLDPWIKSEASKSSQSENADNHIIEDKAEKNRWAMGCFRGDLERDIRFYRGGIERKEDPRKYRKFLTDRDGLVGEELLRQGILKSGLSTAWLDDLMEEWEKIHAQFIQIFSQA